MDEAMRVPILLVLGWLSAGFFLFILAASNPFLRQFEDLQSLGRDLNPLLQDPGFLFHPPMLYMGYVGFSVAFAFAVSALWMGRIDSVWAGWARSWTAAAWSFLTLGITLGSWWAYRELGWGGFWFWDPVENASFMPWLAGTALIHSLILTQKRQQSQMLTLLLAIMTFSLSLIGTFLVRSGVLTSVHAFAVDPTRGYFILGFLGVVIGGSLLLFSLKAPGISAQLQHIVSRESALVLNNVMLIVLVLTILLGTVYPLIVDGFGLGKLSVGAPYFNTIFVPFVLLMMILMGIGIHLKWRQDSLRRFWQMLGMQACVSLAASVFLLQCCFDKIDIDALIGVTAGFWVILNTAAQMLQAKKTVWGMVLAHVGVALTAIGIAVSSGYGIERDVVLSVGERETIAGYTLSFISLHAVENANYHGVAAQVQVLKDGTMRTIYPEKRIYDVTQTPMTAAAIDVTPFRDIYVALGESLGKGRWSLRLYYKPCVRFIWGGGLLMLLGGLYVVARRR